MLSMSMWSIILFGGINTANADKNPVYKDDSSEPSAAGSLLIAWNLSVFWMIAAAAAVCSGFFALVCFTPFRVSEEHPEASNPFWWHVSRWAMKMKKEVFDKPVAGFGDE